MWIYYYASFGPGHQSNDYGFLHYQDAHNMDDIEESLHNMLSEHYGVVLNFWKVDGPPAEHLKGEIEDTKDKIKYYKKYLKTMQETSCFVPTMEEGEDKVLIRNISGCIYDDLLYRLHKAGLMYCASDICDWRYGKKCLTEPHRSKVLSIMRRTKKYPSIKEQLRKKK